MARVARAIGKLLGPFVIEIVGCALVQDSTLEEALSVGQEPLSQLSALDLMRPQGSAQGVFELRDDLVLI